MHDEIVEITLLVTDVLEEMGIRYAVGGSLSSSLHGVMRSTLDVDIVADLREEHVSTFVQALAPLFYADDEMIRDAILHRSSFNLIHFATAFKVDFFILKQRAFDQMQLDHREKSIVVRDPERTVYVTSAEDVILAKLEWYRMGNEVSDRQWRDILGVMRVQSTQLDFHYLEQWAMMLNVDDLLARARKETEL